MHDLDHRIEAEIEARRLPGYVGIVGLDAGGTIRYISADLDGRFGITLTDVVGQSFVEFIAEADLPQAMYSFGGVSERSGHHQALQLRLRDSAGAIHHCDMVAENCLDDPAIGLVLFSLADADDRLRSMQLLDAQAEVVRQLTLGATAAETIGPAMLFLERALPGCRAAAYLTEDIVDDRASAVGSLDETLADRVAAGINGGPPMPGALAINGNEAIVAADLADDRWAPLASVLGDECAAVWSMPIRHDHGGANFGVFEVYVPQPGHPSANDWVTLRLVSRLAAAGADRLHLQRRLQDAADIDPLTSTPNRRVITAMLDQLVMTGGHGRPVCFIDLDRLKVVNDGLGHEAGDELIAVAARCLSRAVGDLGVVGRFGGDEFVAIGNGSGADERQLAERCLEAFAEPVVVAGRPWRITASVGVVVVDQHSSASEILRDADAAMYEAKRRGRNRSHVFDAGTRDAVVRRMDLEHQLARAIERDELAPHFQPVVSTATWRIQGFEALARWPDSGDPWVPPAEFVPLLEEMGLIDRLGALMIRHGLDLVGELDRAGLDAVRVAVNVSPLQLLSSQLFEVLHEATDNNLPLDRVCLEMTEQHMIDESEQTLTSLGRLLDFGVRLSVDDFGTGYSSLGALHRLPANTLKIDRHLTQRVESRQGRSVVAAVVGVARAFAMTTIAEGVETVGQALALRELGVNALQGFLFAPPEPRDVALTRAVRPWPWDVASAELGPQGLASPS